MPADIILYALIAIALIIWLRKTIGTKDDNEPSKPNPITQNNNIKENQKNSDMDNISDSINDLVKNNDIIENKNTAQELHKIMKVDPTFQVKPFIDGASDAFVMIVEAFAKGNKDRLKNLLAPSVFKAFENAINLRNDKGEIVNTEIHAITKAEIIEAKLEKNNAYITIRFAAEETCVIKDSFDKIISGDPDKITKMVDVWVFGRDTKSSDPTWYLFETRDDEIEEHKTPLPEAKQ